VAYLLHFSGPDAFEQTIALKPGTEPVVVGRDPEAAVYLPDAERLVSRRHLSIEWSDGGAQVRVLSPNGISTDQGDWFSGDQVVLGDGQSARVGSFTMRVAAVEPASHLESTRFAGMGSRPMPLGPDTRTGVPVPVKPKKDDPWAQLLAEWSQPQDAPPGAKAEAKPERRSAPPSASPAAPSAAPHLAPAPSSPDGGPGSTRAGTDPEHRALLDLFRGLGIAPPTTPSFDWERFGKSVRQVVECLGEHLAARADARSALRVEDRTLVAAAESNPLRTGMPAKALVEYLLFMPRGGGGFMPPKRALQEAARDARWHQQASQAAVEGMGQEEKDDFNRHYMASYLRELERLRRASLPPPQQRTE
jgi:type VI secretion system FHA domain protein